MQGYSVRFHLTIISLLLVCACVLRVVLFSGFVLGDDPAYADFTSQIVRGSYPPIGTHGVFACRPLVLYAIALPVYLFGWYDWSIVLPILFASLLNTVLVYCAGIILSGPLAGICAAVAYLTFPLDAVHASTLSNDVLLSTFVWGGALLLLVSYNRYQERFYLLLTTLSGFIVGAAVAVKINAIVTLPIFLLVLFVVLWKRVGEGSYKIMVAWAAGWLVANVLFCLFLYNLSGDFLAHYHAEMRFNLDYNPSGYYTGKGSLARTLLYYPKLMVGMEKEGHPGYRFMPYGYFFLCFFLCIPLMAFKRFKNLRLPAVLALVYMLIMEFSPLTLSPNYIPIHRLPRFLHIASLPAAVVIGSAFSTFFLLRSRAVRIGTWLVFGVLIVSSLYWSYVKAAFYKDCALDQRWAWEVVKNTSVKEIITDIEMRNYLMFRFGFHPPMRILHTERLPTALPTDAFIILGGARRPDVYPGYSDAWYRKRQMDGEFLVSEAPFPLTPWRLSTLKIYRTRSNEKKQLVQESQSTSPQRYHQDHPGIKGMRTIAELDVGDRFSEKKLNYSVSEMSWSGSREFTYPNGIVCEDDGKAFRGVEKMMLKNLVQNKPLIVVKRLDPTVAHQKVKVYFQESFIGEWSPNEGGIPGHWYESSFAVPPEFVTDESGELSFSFVKSDCDINSFYYWFFQPE